MRALTPRMRDAGVLRLPQRKPILFNMENFSTPKQAALPWFADLATLAVVVGATWWSGAQRPVSAPMDVRRMATVNQHASALRPSTAPLDAEPASLASASTASADAGPAANQASEGFVSVGFTGAGLR